MKKLLILTLVCFQTALIGAVKLNDADRVIDSVVHVYPNQATADIPVQAELKNIKVRELDQHNRISISKNIDQFIDEAPESKMATVSKRLDKTFISKPMLLREPLYAKGRKEAIRLMPALDQAQTNACVTFSSTAALDILAANGKDLYSCYMSLRLGHAISLNTILASTTLKKILRFAQIDSFDNPWNGAEGIVVLKQFEDFGLVKIKDKNSQNGLFGTAEKRQPLNIKQLNKFIKIPNYKCNLLFHDRVCDIQKAFPTIADFINTIKKEIDKGNLVSIGIALASGFQNSNSGMIGNTKIVNGEGIFTNKKQSNPADYNTWCSSKALGKYIKKNMQDDNMVGSHQMIIIGYIDNLKDPNEGVLILRNSWGAKCGDNGNNYVTYKYAYRLSDELVSVEKGSNVQYL